MFGVGVGRRAVVVALVATVLPFAEPLPDVADAAWSSTFAAGPVVQSAEPLEDRGRLPHDVALVPASSFEVDLTDSPSARAAATGVVSVAASDSGEAVARSAAGSARVDVDVLGEDVAASLRGGKVAFQLSAIDAAAAGRAVAVVIDYESFAYAFGGDWATRLELIELPACALTTPKDPACWQVTPILSSTNAWDQATVSATLTVEGGAVEGVASAGGRSAVEEVESPVYLLMAGTAGDAGDFSASTLSSAASWNVGLGSGGFNWSYPIPTVPSPHGAAPSLAVSYSSQATDGMTVSTNNQPGVVGQSWDLNVGFIERRFKPCYRMGGAVADNCWSGDNAVISFGGQSAELVKLEQSSLPGATEWRLENDENWRVYSFVGSGNDDFQGERWEVTTPDGTTATFGLQHIGGYDHQSVLTVPVVALGSGQPCWDQPQHICDLAYRWMLDSVADTNGNTQSYFWEKESNWYGALGSPGASRAYDMAARLVRLEYGEDGDPGENLYSTEDVGVTFTYEYRCINLSARCIEAPSSSNGDMFPDVPNDLICGSGEFCTNYSPSFFTGYRLKQATSWSRVADVYTYADRIAFVHDWTCEPEDPDQGGDVGVCEGTLDGLATKLWLRGIQRFGSPTSLTAGGTGLPAIRTDSITTANTGWDGLPVGHLWGGGNATLAFPNRADATPSNGIYPQFLYRITQIRDELGAVLRITYGQPSGCIGKTGPLGPWAYVDNASNCYPQWDSATAPGDDGQSGSAAGWVLYNKYIVLLTRQIDKTPGAPEIVTRYDYSHATDNNSASTAAWRYQDSRWATYRTYSDWRGYNQVTVRVGDGVANPTMTRHLLYRGMNGDRVPAGYPGAVNGKRTATVDNQPDDLWLAGIERQTRSMRDGNPLDFTSGTDETLTVRLPTVAVIADTGEFTVRRVRIGKVETYTNSAAASGSAGSSQLKTDTTTVFDFNGFPETIREFGTDGASNVLRCTWNHYAPNTNTWILGARTYTETFDGECNPTPGTAAAQTYFYYDDLNTDPGWATPPAVGNLTQQRVWIDGGSYAVTTWTYDTHGRILTIEDPNGNLTTSAYNTQVGPYTQATTTNAVGHTTTLQVDPRWLAPVSTSDPNGKTTVQTYDPFGRLERVWLPNNATAPAGTPSYEFIYSVAVPAMDNPFDPPEVPAHLVSSKSLHQLAPLIRPETVAYVDTLGRTRQTLAVSPTPGKVIVSGAIGLDGRGVAHTEWEDFAVAGTLTGGVQTPPADALRVVSTYDALSRPEIETQTTNGVDDLTTTIDYDGWTTTVNPPGAASAATVTIGDPFGRTGATIELNNAGIDATTGYTYGAHDLPLTITDHDGNTTTFAYDHTGRRTSLSEPSSGTTWTAYDAVGNVTASTTGVGTAVEKTVAFEYDALNRKTAAWAGAVGTGTKIASWVYDTLPGGLGQPTSSTRHDSSGDYITGVGGYTDRYQPTSSSWAIPASQGALQGTYTYGYTYNLAGSQTSVTHPAVPGLLPETITTGFSDLGIAESLDSDVAGGALDPSGGAFVSDTTFDDIGRVTQRLLGGTAQPNIARTYAYDDFHRLNRLATQLGRDDTFTFDDAGNIDSITDVSVAQRECFDYDSRNRLATAYTTTAPCGTRDTNGPDPYNQSYGFDHLGRMATRDTGPYTYDSVSDYRILSGNGVAYTYNADGTVETRTTAAGAETMTWDQEGRLGATSAATCAPYVSCVTSNIYDANGTRVLRRTPQDATVYVGPDEITTQTIQAEQLGQWTRRGLLGLPINGTMTSDPVTAPGDQLLVATVAYRHAVITAPGEEINLTDNTGGTWTKQAETVTPAGLLDPSIRIAIFTRPTTSQITNLRLTANANSGLLNLYSGWNIQLTAYANATVTPGGSGVSTGTTAVGGPPEVTTGGPLQPGGVVHAGIAQTQLFVPAAGGAITPVDPTTTIELAETVSARPNQQIQRGTTATSAWTLSNPGTWAAAAIALQPTARTVRNVSIVAAVVGTRDSNGQYAIVTGDQHGTGTTTISQDGTPTVRRYTPYGTPRGAEAEWPNERGYLNAPVEPDGIYYLNNRFYDPVSASFVSSDPKVIETREPYLYGGGNPIGQSDPSGLDPTGLFCKAGFATCEADAGAHWSKILGLKLRVRGWWSEQCQYAVRCSGNERRAQLLAARYATSGNPYDTSISDNVNWELRVEGGKGGKRADLAITRNGKVGIAEVKRYREESLNTTQQQRDEYIDLLNETFEKEGFVPAADTANLAGFVAVYSGHGALLGRQGKKFVTWTDPADAGIVWYESLDFLEEKARKTQDAFLQSIVDQAHELQRVDQAEAAMDWTLSHAGQGGSLDLGPLVVPVPVGVPVG